MILMSYKPKYKRKYTGCTKCRKLKPHDEIKQHSMHGKICNDCYNKYLKYLDYKKKVIANVG